MAGFFFHFPSDPSLAALAHRTGATYAGRFDLVATRLLEAVHFRTPSKWPLQWHGAARWRMGGGIGMLAEFSVQPPNGPRSKRLLGVARWEHALPAVTPILFMGPTRWEGPLEARVVPASYARCVIPSSLGSTGISALTPEGEPPVLPRLPVDLISTFLNATGNLLHVAREGAWVLLPDLATVADRRDALACLREVADIGPLGQTAPLLRVPVAASL